MIGILLGLFIALLFFAIMAVVEELSWRLKWLEMRRRQKLWDEWYKKEFS